MAAPLWLQVNEYDEYLVGYQKAAVATEAVAATLNAGQAVVLACGLTAVLVAAATATPAGTFTAGDLVGAPNAPGWAQLVHKLLEVAV